MSAKKVAKKLVRRSKPVEPVKPEPEVDEPFASIPDRPLFSKHQQQNKQRMLEALSKHLGTVFYAVKEAGISRKTHYNWMRDDPEYVNAVEEINNNVGDFAERKILEAIQDKVPAVLIFYAKTKLRHRGYVERHELTGAGGGEIMVGGHLSVSQAQQELPPDAIASILKKVVGGTGQAEKALALLAKK